MEQLLLAELARQRGARVVLNRLQLNTFLPSYSIM